jgi:hypothetical protein
MLQYTHTQQQTGAKMELAIGTKVRYTSAAGTRTAVVSNIKVGPTAKPGFMNTWLTLDIPVQSGVKFNTKVQIAGDNNSLKMFKVEMV